MSVLAHSLFHAIIYRTVTVWAVWQAFYHIHKGGSADF